MADKVGAVMVVGGGIAGIQSSLDLAESGYYVYMVETSPAIGGVMAQLDKTFPTNDCSMCVISPKLVEAGCNLNINISDGHRRGRHFGRAGEFHRSRPQTRPFRGPRRNARLAATAPPLALLPAPMNSMLCSTIARPSTRDTPRQSRTHTPLKSAAKLPAAMPARSSSARWVMWR